MGSRGPWRAPRRKRARLQVHPRPPRGRNGALIVLRSGDFDCLPSTQHRAKYAQHLLEMAGGIGGALAAALLALARVSRRRSVHRPLLARYHVGAGASSSRKQLAPNLSPQRWLALGVLSQFHPCGRPDTSARYFILWGTLAWHDDGYRVTLARMKRLSTPMRVAAKPVITRLALARWEAAISPWSTPNCKCAEAKACAQLIVQSCRLCRRAIPMDRQ
jgi:hypothetical protein